MANDGFPPTAVNGRGGRNKNTPTEPRNTQRTIDTMWKAAQLRAAGATFREVGEALGIDHTWARTLVLRALESAKYEQADLMRTQEGMRLDRLQRAYWPQALNGDKHAAKIVLDVMRRRAILFGLNAPTKVEVSADVDAEIARLAAQLAADDAHADTPA